eukprot:9951853-Ditylum_brightwellii.AAC.2
MGKCTKKKPSPTWQGQLLGGDRFHRVFGLPEGSYVIANETGCMDDETWLRVVKILALEIRKRK